MYVVFRGGANHGREMSGIPYTDTADVPLLLYAEIVSGRTGNVRGYRQ